MKRGMTLLELLIAVVMLAAVMGVAGFLFSVVLKTWVSQEARAGVDMDLNWRMGQVVRDLREAMEIQSTAGYHEVRFTPDETTYYIYYLYNENDAYAPPPAFNQDLYQLRRATLTGDINGTFAYGSGNFILGDILPPTTSEISATGDVITIDLSVERRDETVRTRSQVNPRNL